MSLIDRKFLLEVFLSIVIKKMLTLMTVRGIDVNMHNVSEYVRLQMYLFNKNGITRVEREFYIVDDLAVKALVGIDIMKSEGMILDIEKNVMIIGLCKNIQIFFIFVSHRPQIRVTIFSDNKTKMIIPPHFNMAVSVAGLKCRSLKLLCDRDFLFESQKLDTLLVYIYIVNHNMLKIFVRNDINHVISLSRKVKLKMIIDYKAARCYVIDFFEHDLVTKASKRSFN